MKTVRVTKVEHNKIFFEAEMISEHDPNGMFPFGLRIMDYDSDSKLSVYCFDTDEDLYKFRDSKQACNFLDTIDKSGIVYSVVYVTDDKIKSK